MSKKNKKINPAYINLALFLLILVVGLNQFFIYKINNSMNLIKTSTVKNEVTSSESVALDNGGYEKLLEYEETISLTPEQNKQIVGLDINLPCCGVQKIQAAGNCGCGHHLALHGLAKYMITNGYDRNEIQNEIDKWKTVFYPESGSGSMGGC
ncbi:MAG: hypothetical protein J4428_01005 [Candidatus Aenigmarchaeota archaeon]|nr:hypothetical protein [Candidatus Aenigmarchaeota archaeon]